MLQRWQRFRRNARTVDVIRTVLFVPVFIALACFMFEGADLLVAGGVLVASFFLPFLAAGFFARHLRQFLFLTSVVPIAFAIVAYFFRDKFLDTPALFYALILFLGLYVGAFFWVFSHPMVNVRSR